jgi:MerR family transcriptional regulator/heat shock protein HspR
MAARRTTRVTAKVATDRGVFMISVAAELADMHPQTLRMYEARGLIEPKRSPKGTRLYSHDQRKVDALETRAATLQEEIKRLEEIRRTVKAEIVRYEAPGTALIPIRHVRRGD